MDAAVVLVSSLSRVWRKEQANTRLIKKKSIESEGAIVKRFLLDKSSIISCVLKVCPHCLFPFIFRPLSLLSADRFLSF